MLASRPAEVWRYRDLLQNLVLRDLRIRYKGSTLGFAWSLLHPLLMAAVYTLAFRYIVRIRVEHFPVFLLSGLLPWTFFASALSIATGSVADNAPLVRKVAFPRAILPLAAVASQFVQFLLMYAVVVPLAVVAGVGASPALVTIVLLALIQLALTSGLALALATAYAYFRDTRHLVDVLLQVWFWLTPVVYPLTLVPPELQRFFLLNPLTLVVTGYQRAILDHAFPPLWALGTLTLAAGAILAGGFLVFLRHEQRFAELV